MIKKNFSMKKNQGFTLLEALIGFLILSIGMLGIASLQATSLKAGKTSVYRSVAMMKVDELFESIRANFSADALTAYAVASVGAGTNNNCSGTTECSDVQLAQDDIYWWKQNLKAGLPDATAARVVVTAAVAPSKMATVNIQLRWSERDKNSTGSVSTNYITTANICTEIPC